VGRSLLDSLASRSTSLQADSSGIREDVQSVLQQLKAVGYVEDFSVEWRKEGAESAADEPDLRTQLRVSRVRMLPELESDEIGTQTTREFFLDVSFVKCLIRSGLGLTGLRRC
jgi:hypothetical protein